MNLFLGNFFMILFLYTFFQTFFHVFIFVNIGRMVLVTDLNWAAGSYGIDESADSIAHTAAVQTLWSRPHRASAASDETFAATVAGELVVRQGGNFRGAKGQ